MNERIKKILEELGLKKVEFAERLHISRPYASELCSGAQRPHDQRHLPGVRCPGSVAAYRRGRNVRAGHPVRAGGGLSG